MLRCPPPPAAWTLILSLLAVTACASDGARADNSPCVSPFDCASGLCVALPNVGRVCARRCAPSSCPATQVCGRFDFRGRNDAGALSGEASDIVRVCRAPLSPRCADGCAPGEGCLAGLCARPCAASADCGGRGCVRAQGCAAGLCAAPCDETADCPAARVCNTALEDNAGHGECVPLVGDAATDAPSDASECGITP